jgi:predicted DNA-binding protein (MmcQ/YjbR family)
MTASEFNAFCQALTATTHVVQWGGADVWKVGGKVFAIGWWDLGEPAFTFKVSDISYEMLKQEPGLRPAPYLASRGLKWIQHYAQPGLDDAGLRDYIRLSHRIVARGLPKKTQRALGIVE